MIEMAQNKHRIDFIVEQNPKKHKHNGAMIMTPNRNSLVTSNHDIQVTAKQNSVLHSQPQLLHSSSLSSSFASQLPLQYSSCSFESPQHNSPSPCERTTYPYSCHTPNSMSSKSLPPTPQQCNATSSRNMSASIAYFHSLLTTPISPKVEIDYQLLMYENLETLRSQMETGFRDATRGPSCFGYGCIWGTRCGRVIKGKGNYRRHVECHFKDAEKEWKVFVDKKTKMQHQTKARHA